MKNQTQFEVFCCSLKCTHDMEVNFGYVVLNGMFRFVTKVDRSLIYDLFRLYARLNLMLFIAPLINFSLSTSAP
jgi:hypothetical protein